MPSLPDHQIRLVAGDHEVVVDIHAGARATSWTFRGLEVLGGAGHSPVEYGMYPMAPWAGRLRGNRVAWNDQRYDLPLSYEGWALHGTCLDRAGRVVARDASSLAVRFEDHPSWPWPAAVEVAWRLEPHALVTSLSVEALDDPFPAVVGWHPWFRRELGTGEPVRWAVDATEQLVRGDDHLPTGERIPYDASAGPFDDAFVVPSGRASLTWPGALAIDVVSEGSWYVVFDGRPEAVCLEPQSGPPDGLDGNHGVAAPATPLTMRTTWAMRDLRG